MLLGALESGLIPSFNRRVNGVFANSISFSHKLQQVRHVNVDNGEVHFHANGDDDDDDDDDDDNTHRLYIRAQRGATTFHDDR